MQDINTVVVKRSDGVNDTQTVQTNQGEPNIRVTPLTVTRVILTRTARVYVQTLLAFLTAGMPGMANAILPEKIAAVMPTDFFGLLVLSAQIAVAPAAVTFIQNVGELLVRLDEKAPQWRA